MPSNTGKGNSVVSSGCAAGAVGDTECAAEALVSLGFAFSAEVLTNCVRLDENAAAASVATKDHLTATDKVNHSSPTSKYAVPAVGVDASYVEDAGDGFISRVGLALGSLDAQVTKDPSQGTAGISFVSVGVVCSSDEIQGDAGGAAEILLGQNNADILLGTNATNAEVFGENNADILLGTNATNTDVFGAAQQTVLLGPCSNVVAGDGVISRVGLALGSLDAQVTKDPSQGTACISFVSVGVVCSLDEIQGDAGGAAKILLGQNNADIFLGTNATNAEGFGAAQQTVSLGPCSNVNDHIHSQSSSPLKNPLGSLEEESVCSPVPIQKARQYFKKRPRKLCRQLYRGGRTDRKISSVDHAN